MNKKELYELFKKEVNEYETLDELSKELLINYYHSCIYKYGYYDEDLKNKIDNFYITTQVSYDTAPEHMEVIKEGDKYFDFIKKYFNKYGYSKITKAREQTITKDYNFITGYDYILQTNKNRTAFLIA